MGPRIAPGSRGVSRKIEDLDNPFPDCFALKDLLAHYPPRIFVDFSIQILYSDTKIIGSVRFVGVDPTTQPSSFQESYENKGFRRSQGKPLNALIPSWKLSLFLDKAREVVED